VEEPPPYVSIVKGVAQGPLGSPPRGRPGGSNPSHRQPSSGRLPSLRRPSGSPERRAAAVKVATGLLFSLLFVVQGRVRPAWGSEVRRRPWRRWQFGPSDPAPPRSDLGARDMDGGGGSRRLGRRRPCPVRVAPVAVAFGGSDGRGRGSAAPAAGDRRGMAAAGGVRTWGPPTLLDLGLAGRLLVGLGACCTQATSVVVRRCW
jgi:hypothetical protein